MPDEEPTQVPSVVATLALLVAAAYAFIVVAAGLRLVAHGYRPAQFGLSVNSDFNYPRTDQMFIGIVVAVFGGSAGGDGGGRRAWGVERPGGIDVVPRLLRGDRGAGGVEPLRER